MLTVLMATHNGAETLPPVLAAHCGLKEPEGGWQLVVVDNASTDGTRAIVLSFADRLPLTYLFERHVGQNRARNAGLSALEGDLLVLTDDDAVPRPDWLVELRTAADRHREFAMFGGTVLPRWARPPERWLLHWVPPGPTFAITDRSLPAGPVKSSFVNSPNMALRADILRASYRFDESIGPDGTSIYAMGSETELTRRLTAQGLRAWHCREAIVEHIIRPHQMTRRWVLGRAFRYGRGQFRLALKDPRSGRRRPRRAAPVRLLASLGLRCLRLADAKCRETPEDVFKRSWDVFYVLGAALEAWASLSGRRVAAGGPAPLAPRPIHLERREVS
ncbi:MAG: glycosyltransferase [Candidatus Rokuibacteriota bacterium]